HRRAVALASTNEALDALARLHAARGEHAQAVGWLEQRLRQTEPGHRAPTVVRLAQAHAGAGRSDRATAVLEAALGEEPSALEVRALLGGLYRGAGMWEPLARLLTDGADHLEDPAGRLAALREAGEIYLRRLGAPVTAVPILERAVALAPKDRSARTALADA